MVLVVNHNLMAINASHNLSKSFGALETSTRRLSSGLRIIQASDDAAGLAVRELMRSLIASLQQDIRNVNDAISLLQTAEGTLNVIDEKLIHIKELTMQASTGTYNSDQRMIIVSKDKIRANLGALQNRLENTVTTLENQAENMQAAESRISDADVATEMTAFVKNQIMTQAAVSMLSQANSLPRMTLSLMG